MDDFLERVFFYFCFDWLLKYFSSAFIGRKNPKLHLPELVYLDNNRVITNEEYARIQTEGGKNHANIVYLDNNRVISNQEYARMKSQQQIPDLNEVQETLIINDDPHSNQLHGVLSNYPENNDRDNDVKRAVNEDPQEEDDSTNDFAGRKLQASPLNSSGAKSPNSLVSNEESKNPNSFIVSNEESKLPDLLVSNDEFMKVNPAEDESIFVFSPVVDKLNGINEVHENIEVHESALETRDEYNQIDNNVKEVIPEGVSLDNIILHPSNNQLSSQEFHREDSNVDAASRDEGKARLFSKDDSGVYLNLI